MKNCSSLSKTADDVKFYARVLAKRLTSIDLHAVMGRHELLDQAHMLFKSTGAPRR